MSLLARALLWAITAAAAVVIVRQHVGYLRRNRSYSFGAFLETAGWIIILLVSVAALYGGLEAPGTRAVEIAAAIVGVLFVGIGSSFR